MPEETTPQSPQETAPSTTEPVATNLATQDAADPDAANPEVNPNATAEKKSGAPAPTEAAAQGAVAQKAGDADLEAAQKPGAKPAATKSAAAAGSQEANSDKPAGQAGEKKPKKEAKPAIEDKPFADFIQQDYLPALEKAFAVQNVEDLQLTFADNQVTGRWKEGRRQFTVYFPKADINGQKAFSWANDGTTPSTIEPFLIDERKANLTLLVFGVIQRLNGQKWFGKN